MKRTTHIPIFEKDGSLFLKNDRVIITSTNVFGELRADLSENIGDKRVKGFLLRYGWNLGKKDAEKIRKNSNLSLEQMLRQGPILHELQGYTKVQNTRFDIVFCKDGSIKNIHVEGIWFNSYEAEEYVKMKGFAQKPVCYTLIGYASGYYSTVTNRHVIFKEVSCKGTGDEKCTYVGKTLDLWGSEVEEELNYYESDTIAQELEVAYDSLIEERNNLQRALRLNERLTLEIMKGKGLQPIARTVFAETNIPFLIFNASWKVVACVGIEDEELNAIEESIINMRLDKSKQQYEVLLLEKKQLLIAPIQIERDLFGYATFVYKLESDISDIDYMMLDRATSVCSICLLNERIKYIAMERVKGTFLEQMITKQLKTKDEVLQRASYVQLDMEQPYYVIAIKAQLKTKSVNELLLYDQIMERIFQFFKNNQMNVLTGQADGNIVFLMQKQYVQMYMNIEQFWSQLTTFLLKTNKYLVLKAGMSTVGKDIGHIHPCYKEAIIALRMNDNSGTILSFQDVGITGLLLHTKDVEAIRLKATEVLSPLYKMSEVSNKDHIITLYIFLTHGGNLEKTMKDLSLSLSGLRYRISRIENLLQKNIRDPQHSYELLVTLNTLTGIGELPFLKQIPYRNL